MNISHNDKNNVELKKETILQNYIDWIKERVFANSYALSKGTQLFAPEEFNKFHNLPVILKENLSYSKQYYSRCLRFVTQRHDFPILDINFVDLYIAVRLMEDEIIELKFDNLIDYDESYVKYKPVLIARYNNHNFDDELKNILCSEYTIADAFFRYVLHAKLEDNYEFYERSVIKYIEKANTKKIVSDLEDVRLPEQIHSKFVSDVATLIDQSTKSSTIKISFDSILQNDSISKVLSDIPQNSSDKLLDEYIVKAKAKWVKGEMFDCVRELWDALERIKTILAEKKVGVDILINEVSNSIYSSDMKAFDYTKELFNNEFKLLTEIGNTYTIRHTETNKYDIHDKPELLKYFIKRVSTLLELFLKAIPSE